jgi:hypothetical protein
MAITELSVAVNFARRADWVGEAPHTYFYVNGRLKVPKILQTLIEFIAVLAGKPKKGALLLPTPAT